MVIKIPSDRNTRGAGDIFYESPSQHVHDQMVWKNYKKKCKTQRNGHTEPVICADE